MAEQQLLIPEENYITPLKEILNDVTPQPTTKPQRDLDSIKNSLDTLFPEQHQDEKQVKKAKEIIGTLADALTEVELKTALTEIQFLMETWMDNFERNIFNGLTLQELLHERGGR